ncbi:MAG: DinB family protein [Bryobacteraceae bacterium]
MDSEITSLFVTHSVKSLRKMNGHIASCVARLTDDQIWARGASHENSIGNLALHLCGNVRQWIGSGVGAEPDIREREKEFSTQGGLSRADLLSRLNGTVDHAAAIIERVTAERLAEKITPQGETVTVLDAIYNVVGHFQQHTGQIVFATKILCGEDLGLYRPKAAVTQAT